MKIDIQHVLDQQVMSLSNDIMSELKDPNPSTSTSAPPPSHPSSSSSSSDNRKKKKNRKNKKKNQQGGNQSDGNGEEVDESQTQTTTVTSGNGGGGGKSGDSSSPAATASTSVSSTSGSNQSHVGGYEEDEKSSSEPARKKTKLNVEQDLSQSQLASMMNIMTAIQNKVDALMKERTQSATTAVAATSHVVLESTVRLKAKSSSSITFTVNKPAEPTVVMPDSKQLEPPALLMKSFPMMPANAEKNTSIAINWFNHINMACENQKWNHVVQFNCPTTWGKDEYGMDNQYLNVHPIIQKRITRPDGSIDVECASAWVERDKEIAKKFAALLLLLVEGNQAAKDYVNAQIATDPPAGVLWFNLKQRFVYMTKDEMRAKTEQVRKIRQLSSENLQPFLDRLYEGLSVLCLMQGVNKIEGEDEIKRTVILYGSLKPYGDMLTQFSSESFEAMVARCRKMEEANETRAELHRPEAKTSASAASVNYSASNSSSSKHKYNYGKGGSGPGGWCKTCGKTTALHTTDTHMKGSRPQKKKEAGGEKAKSASASTPSSSEKKHKFVGKCYWCNKSGHSIANCEYKKAGKPVAADALFAKDNKDKKRKRVDSEQNAVIVSARSDSIVSSPETEPYNVVNCLSEVREVNVVSTNHAEMLVDSGANISTVMDPTMLTNGKVNSRLKITVASGQQLNNPTVGKLQLNVGGKQVIIDQAIAHTGMNRNLLSVSQMTKSAYEHGLLFTNHAAYASKKALKIGNDADWTKVANQKDGLYVVPNMSSQHQSQSNTSVNYAGTSMTKTWHNILTHINASRIAHALRMKFIVIKRAKKLDSTIKDVCEPCMNGKMTRVSFNTDKVNRYADLQPRENMFFDIAGPFPASRERYKYFLIGVDAATNWKYIGLLQSKDEAYGKIKALVEECKVKFNSQQIKTISTDGGGEFSSVGFVGWAASKGITLQKSPPRTPQMNGKVERQVRTVKEAIRSVMHKAGAPVSLWADAALYVAHVINLVYPSPHGAGSLQQEWSGKKHPASTNWLNVWGCDIHRHIPGAEQQGAFSSQSEVLIYLGLDPVIKGMKVFDWKSNSVKVSVSTKALADSFTEMAKYKRGMPINPDEVRHFDYVGSEAELSDMQATLIASQQLHDMQQQGERKDSGVTSMDIDDDHTHARSKHESDAAASSSSSDPSWYPSVESSSSSSSSNRTTRSTSGSGGELRINRVKTRLANQAADYSAYANIAMVHGFTFLVEMDPLSHQGEDLMNIHEYLEELSITEVECNSAEVWRANNEEAYSNHDITQEQMATRKYKNGQVEMASQQCTSSNCKGTQCKSRTKYGIYCWTHLRAKQALRIKQSQIANAGKGLYAAKTFSKGEEVAKYTGDRIATDMVDKRSMYVLELSRKVCLDAARTNTAPGRMLNDSRGTGKCPNCAFVIDTRNKTARILTTKRVMEGDEFLVSYGAQYAGKNGIGGIKQAVGSPTNPIVLMQVGIEQTLVQNKMANRRLDLLVATVDALNDINPNTPDPTSTKEALSSSECEQWQAAIDDENNSLIKTGAFRSTVINVLPVGVKAIKMRYLLKRKWNLDGTCKYKARLIAIGCSQVMPEGLDEMALYAPVLNYKTLRTVLALANALDWELRQLDVKTAFLQADLSEEVYLNTPAQWPMANQTRYLVPVKALYGLRASPKAWNDTVTSVLKGMGMIQSWSDPCLFTRNNESGCVIVAVFVDDIVGASTKANKHVLEGVIDQLKKTWPINDMGEVKHILGMEVTRYRDVRVLRISQQPYIKKLLKHVGLEAILGKKTPEVDKSTLEEQFATKQFNEQGRTAASAATTSTSAAMSMDDEEPYVDTDGPKLQLQHYGMYVGSLLYVACMTHPELQHSVMMLSKKLQKPDEQDLFAVKRVFAYLNTVKETGLCYSAVWNTVDGIEVDEPHVCLAAFSDADWANDTGNRRSISGVAIMLGNAVVL